MRFRNVMAIVLVFCLLGTGITFGGNAERAFITLQDSTTKTSATYKVINTIVNGKVLETDVPGYLVEKDKKQTVYVPISTIYRTLNASVSWSAKTKKLTIVQGKNTYVIEIGKNYVYVNNQKQMIEENMPATLMKYAGVDRTMVPVSVISKQMGMEIKYQPEISTVNISQSVGKVQGIAYNGMAKYKEIRIKTTAEMSTTNYMIDGTPFGGKSKVIVEFQNAVLDQGVNTVLEVNDKAVKQVNLVNPNRTPPRVRVEVELTGPQGYYTYYDKGAKEQVIQIANTLKDIQYTASGAYHLLQLNTVAKPVIAVEKLDNKLVVDFLDTKLAYNSGSASTKAVNNSGLITVAYSQYSSSGKYEAGRLVSRVVLNFASNGQRDRAYVKTTKEGIQVYVEGDPDQGISYMKDTGSTSTLKFPLTKNITAITQTKAESNEFIIKMPKAATKLENISKKYNDNVISSIAVDANSDAENYLITVKLAAGTVAYDVSYPEAASYAFINEKIKNSANQKTLIVLDAGHGGSDPGAIGKFTGVKEKDLTLRAVYALKAELEKNGYIVALTRTGDSKLELLQRTDLANEINASLLVSIHYNAVDSPTINGVEVLYYNDGEGKKKALARILHDELVAASGAKSRGIVERPLLVVPRETKMPSALIEMGFITNKDEERLVQSDAYLAVQVKSIVSAIEKYLNK